MSGPINAIAFSSDNNQILLAAKQMIQMYSYEDLGTWTLCKYFLHHTDMVTAFSLFSGTNYERFASASNDGTVCIWSFTEEEPLHVIKLKDEIVRN